MHAHYNMIRFVPLLLIGSMTMGLSAQNVVAPDASSGQSGSEVLAASNAAGTGDVTFYFTPTGDDDTYTVIIKDDSGAVVDSVFQQGECVPITIPKGGKADIKDTDPSSPDDTDDIKGNATTQ